jgi:FixJ family two-component response regulator
MAQQKVAVADTPDWTLTAEQATAVDQLASGRTVSEIAEALEVSPQTVSEWCKSHLGPAGAFAQKHTVLHNVLSDNSLHGHIIVSRCRGSSSYCLLRGSFEL